ncbi:hypothetical protein AAE478_004827 [Parahypoxylon ruwenzoriense]
MADFGWLRLGQRSRTPTTPRSPTSSERGPSRVPSYLSLASRASHSPEPLSSAGEASLLVREQDKIWYNPSLDQMVEALQVAIMTQGVLKPIPVEYNSYILHLIEGFADSQENIRIVNTACAEAKQSLEQHLEHFKSVADEWLERENQYKIEIKRLEVLLSRTSRDGLEAVTLARTNSVIDRSGPQAKQFVSKLKRFSTQSVQGKSKPVDVAKACASPGQGRLQETKASLPKILDNNNDFLISEKIRRHAAANTSTVHARDKQLRYTEMPSRHTFATGEKSEGPTAPTGDTTLQPLFSDDVSDASDIDSKAEAKRSGPTANEMNTRRQIMQSLLDYTACPDGGDDANPHSGNVLRLSNQFKPEQVSASIGTRDSDSKHLRGLSGFSFVPGDDIFSTSSCDGAGDRTKRGAISSEEDNNAVELWQRGPGVTISPSRTWENRRSIAAGRIPQDSSTSSIDTVIRSLEGTTVATRQNNSPGVRRTMAWESPSRDSHNVGLFPKSTNEGATSSPR